MHCSFNIFITEEFHIKCSITPVENGEIQNEIVIQIYQNQNEYPLCLEFTKKDIILCQKSTN